MFDRRRDAVVRPKLNLWVKWGCLTPIAILAALILGGYATLCILDSPRNVLRHVLHLDNLPSSIQHLRMGSDVWTDEVRGFYFEVAPDQFPLLLAGRDFRLVDLGTTYEAKTIHVKPAVTFTARWRYMWETNGADCTIDANETKDRVAILFSAD